MKQSRSKSGRFETYSDHELWKIYNELYDKVEDKRGKDNMYSEKFEHYEQFQAEIVMARNAGEKVNVRLVKDIVDAQSYKLTSAQAGALIPALKEASLERAQKRLESEKDLSDSERRYLENVVEKGGVSYSKWQIRSGFGNVDVAMEQISNTYRQLRSEGLNSYAAQDVLKTMYRFRGRNSP